MSSRMNADRSSAGRAADPDRVTHVAQFHSDGETLTDRVCEFFTVGANFGDALIVIATPKHRAMVETCLHRRGVDLAALRAAGRYTTLDAAETLSRILIGGKPNPLLFGEVVGGAISRLVPESGRVRAFGEMVSLLWAEGQRDAAIRLEDIWNEWIGFHPLSLMCGYAFDGAIDATGFSAIAATHSDVIPPPDHRRRETS
jgi:hypothetical protein